MAQLLERIKQVGWWLWFATELSLVAGLFIDPRGLDLAIAITIFQVIYWGIVDRKWITFTIQVRIGFLLILVLGKADGLAWIYYIPLVGLAVMLLTGYCFLARFMSLLPGIRKEPLTPSLLKKTFLTPPTRGSILKNNQC